MTERYPLGDWDYCYLHERLPEALVDEVLVWGNPTGRGFLLSPFPRVSPRTLVQLAVRRVRSPVDWRTELVELLQAPVAEVEARAALLVLQRKGP